MSTKRQKDLVDVATRIPVDVLTHYMEVAKLAKVTPAQAMNVVLALEVLKFKRATARRGV